MESFLLTTSPDPFTRGLAYLYGVRSLALEPDLIDLMADSPRRRALCTWIGSHIEAVNAQLHAQLQACHACFHAPAQPTVQLFAAPLAPAFGLAGLCNLQTQPITLLLDVGRVIPAHWLRLLAHEYAHAQVGVPGHHAPFARALTQLCLGLSLPLPLAQRESPDCLRFAPACQYTQDPGAFWHGDSALPSALD